MIRDVCLIQLSWRISEKVTFEQGPEESEGECYIDIYSIPDRGQEVQSSEEGVCLAGPRNHRVARVARVE